MPKAVRFDQYGGLDALQVAEVERPTPLQGDVLVRVRPAASIPLKLGFGRVSCTASGRRRFPPARALILRASSLSPAPVCRNSLSETR